MFKILSTVFCLALFMGCTQDKEKIRYHEYKIDSIENVLWNIENAYRSSYFLKLDTINPITKIVNPELDTSRLIEIIANTNRIFFYYSDLHCSSCLDKQLLNLQQFQSNFGADYMCILGSVQSYRKIAALMINYNFTCDIYAIPNKQPIFKHHNFIPEPFYFTLQEDGSIDMFHLPIVSDSMSTDIFLKVCKQKLRL